MEEITLEALNGELGEFSPLLEGELNEDFAVPVPGSNEAKNKNKNVKKTMNKNKNRPLNAENRPQNTDNKIVVPKVEELDLSMARLIYRMNGELMLLRRELVALRLALADPERSSSEAH